MKVLFFLLLFVINVQTQTRAIKLSWDPAIDITTTGYVVSYGTIPNLYTKSVVLDVVTTYTLVVPTVTDTYYIVVQAINALGERSSLSNEVVGIGNTTTIIVPPAPTNPRFVPPEEIQ